MIYNVRLGFATNSSSTHSIIFTTDKIKSRIPKDGYFGWEFFTLAKKSEKKAYLATILYTHLHYVGEVIVRKVGKKAGAAAS